MKNMTVIASLLSLALFVPAAQSQTSHAFLWTATGGMQDLGTLGGSFSQAQGINASGQVVGYSYLAGDTTYHAFLWTASSGMQDLGAPDGANSVAMAINSAGQVVGYSSSPATSKDHIYHAILWTSDVMRNLGTLGGKSSYGTAINDAGVGMDAAAAITLETSRAAQRRRMARRIVPQPLRLPELTRGFVGGPAVHFTTISAVSPNSPTRWSSPCA